MDSTQYGPLLAWLRENIHRYGALWDPAELIRRATGREPEAQYHLAHLRSRYVDK